MSVEDPYTALERERQRLAVKSVHSHPLRDSLKEFIRRNKLERQGGLAEIRSLWHDVVGEELTTMTRVESFRNGVLRIAVTSAALKSELETYYREDLIVSLRQAQPSSFIRAIEFILEYSGK